MYKGSDIMSKKHEALVGKGIRIERHGRFIYFDMRRSEAEHKEILSALASLRPRLEKDIPLKAEQLRKQLEPYNSFDIISNISFINLFVDPEKYKEYAHEELQFIVEYITLLCLMDDFSEGGNPLEQGPPDLQTIQNTAKEILNDALLYMATKRAFVFNGKIVTPRGYKKRCWLLTLSLLGSFLTGQ